MKRIIYKYLSKHFIIHNEFLYIKNTNRHIVASVLTYELYCVFDLSKKQVKPYVKDWAKSNYKHFNFKEYWKTLYPQKEDFVWYSGGIQVGYPRNEGDDVQFN